MLRLLLAILCALLCGHIFLADCLALTLEEISLMLRAGYPSKAILEDISIQHFHGTLDIEAERELVELHASPALIEALKSGQYDASESENRAKEKSIAQQALEGKRIAQQAELQAIERASEQQRFGRRQVTVRTPHHDPAISDESLLPSEKKALETYDMLTASEMRFLTPSEKEALNKRKRMAKEVEDRAAYVAWCKAQPVVCAQLEAAKSEASAAREEARRQKAARAEEEAHEEAREIKRKYEWAIRSEGNRPASSISVLGTAFPQSEEARKVKETYESAIRDARDKPASSINVFVPFP